MRESEMHIFGTLCIYSKQPQINSTQQRNRIHRMLKLTAVRPATCRGWRWTLHFTHSFIVTVYKEMKYVANVKIRDTFNLVCVVSRNFSTM